MPVPFRDAFTHSCPFGFPACAGFFVLVAVVAELHHVVDSHTPVTIIIIVRLPDAAVGIDGDHPVVSEIPTKSFKLAAIHVAAEHHAFLIRLAIRCDNDPGCIDDGLTILILDLSASISKIEIQLSVWAESEGMNSVIVL